MSSKAGRQGETNTASANGTPRWSVAPNDISYRPGYDGGIMHTGHSTDIQTYRAAWFIGPQGAIPNASVTMSGARLLDVQSSHSPNAVDLGEVAIVPGLVNVHTHLEFSRLSEPIPMNGRFTDWIRSVVNYRRQHPDIAAEAIRAGIDESVRCGTTLIGDIATTGWSMNEYLDAGFSGVVFQELLGLTDERVSAQREVAQRINTTELDLRSSQSDTAIRSRNPTSLFASLGLSPHAPYSVHPRLFHAAIEISQQSGSPLAMHLAETEAELELLAEGTGEFREMLTEFGLWREGLFGGGQRPMQYLEALAESPAPLIVHGNYLDEAELRFLAERPHMTLAYCPRTHAAFGHRPHPWRRLIELGGSVALGTDSRASNPDLSLFAELQFLAAQHPDISHLDLLTLATTNGRHALLRSRQEPEPDANFTVIRLSDPRFRDPQRDLFAPANRIVGTILSGDWRFAAPDLRV